VGWNMMLFVISANHVVVFLSDLALSPASVTPLPPVPCTGYMSSYHFS
jgi:hypothetical protein